MWSTSFPYLPHVKHRPVRGVQHGVADARLMARREVLAVTAAHWDERGVGTNLSG